MASTVLGADDARQGKYHTHIEGEADIQFGSETNDREVTAAASSLPSLSYSSLNFARGAGKYLMSAEGGQLFVTLRRAKGSVDPRSGQLDGATVLSFGSKRIGMVSPIILDLDGDGVELKSLKKSHARFDMDGDGIRDETGWVGKHDGLLVVDRNGDGRITAASELSFLAEDPTATSDLQGLAAFDSNNDGAIDGTDSRFVELKLWVDRNGNGVSDTGELSSLEEQGIKSLSLDAIATSATAKVGDNVLLATSTFTRTDGTKGTFGDVALAFRPSMAGPAADAASGGSAIPDPSGVDLWQSEPAASNPRLSEPLIADRLRERMAAFETGPADGFGSPSMASGEAETDYATMIRLANARLVQAMSSFGDKPAMMQRPGSADLQSEAGDWLTVAALPSVSRLLAVGNA